MEAPKKSIPETSSKAEVHPFPAQERVGVYKGNIEVGGVNDTRLYRAPEADTGEVIPLFPLADAEDQEKPLDLSTESGYSAEVISMAEFLDAQNEEVLNRIKIKQAEEAERIKQAESDAPKDETIDVTGVAEKTDASLRISDSIRDLETSFLEASDFGERMRIAEEIKVKNRELKETLERDVEFDIHALGFAKDPQEISRLQTRIKAHKNIIADIKHPGRQVFEMAINRLEGELAKLQGDGIEFATEAVAEERRRINGELKAYRSLLQESLNSKESVTSARVAETQFTPSAVASPKSQPQKTSLFGRATSWFKGLFGK